MGGWPQISPSPQKLDPLVLGHLFWSKMNPAFSLPRRDASGRTRSAYFRSSGWRSSIRFSAAEEENRQTRQRRRRRDRRNRKPSRIHQRRQCRPSQVSSGGLSHFPYTIVALLFCVDTEPHTCRNLRQLLDFELTSNNRVSQVG